MPIPASRLVVAAALALLPAQASGNEEFSAARWRADFAFLKLQLESSYANLAWFGTVQSGVDLPELNRRTERALDAATSDAEAKAAIRQFVSGFGDGHFSELSFLGAEPSTPAREPDKIDTSGMSAEAACAARGYADKSPVAFSLPFETIPGFRLMSDGAKTAFRSGIYHQGKVRLGVVRIKNFSQSQYPTVCEKAWDRLSPALRADPDGFSEEIVRLWLLELSMILRDFRKRQLDGVIVDVGNNSGGNDSGDWAVRLFTSATVTSARVRMTTGKPFVRYLDDERQELDSVLSKSRDAKERSFLERASAVLARRAASGDTRSCDLKWVWVERRNWDPEGCTRLSDAGWASGPFLSAMPKLPPTSLAARTIYWPAHAEPFRGSWTGPVFVLTNGATYSSAEMFAAAMSDNRVGVTVGTRTGGDGCGFLGSSPPAVLPNSKLRFRMSNCVRLRADNLNEVAGVAPAIEISPVQGESSRARLVRLVQTLERRLSETASKPCNCWPQSPHWDNCFESMSHQDCFEACRVNHAG